MFLQVNFHYLPPNPEPPVNCVRYTLLVKSQPCQSRTALLYLELPLKRLGAHLADPWKSYCFTGENLQGMLLRLLSILGNFWGLNKRFYNYILRLIFRPCFLPVAWIFSLPRSHFLITVLFAIEEGWKWEIVSNSFETQKLLVSLDFMFYSSAHTTFYYRQREEARWCLQRSA